VRVRRAVLRVAALCRGGRGAQVSRLLALHAYLHGESAAKREAASTSAAQAAQTKAENDYLAANVCSVLCNTLTASLF
jgi:hypothetical protein